MMLYGTSNDVSFPEMDKRNMIFAPSITVLGNNNENISLPKPSIIPETHNESIEMMNEPINPIVVKSTKDDTHEKPEKEKLENLSNVDFSKDIIIKKV